MRKLSIYDKGRYTDIITNIINKFGADPACKDLARFYYPNPKQEVYYLDKTESQYFDVTPFDHPVEKVVKNDKKQTKSQEYLSLNATDIIISEDEVEMSAKEWHETAKNAPNRPPIAFASGA